MTRFLYGDLLWKEIANRSKKTHRTRAAIAYVTRELPLSFRPDDILIVDATDGAIASGQTSAIVLAKLLKSGVQLFSHAGLHAKIVVFDSLLFASSANLSESSVSRMFEAGLETDNPNSVSGAVGVIERLSKKSVRIDAMFVARVKKIPVKRGWGAAKSSVRKTPSGYRQPVTWLMGVHDIEEPKNPEELRRIEAGEAKAEELFLNPKSSSAWIRFGSKGRISEVRQGDNLVLIDRPTPDADPKRVYQYAPVRRVQHEPNCTRIFYEEVPNAEKKSLTWGKFKKLAKAAGLQSNLSKNSTRMLSEKISASLNENWERFR